MLNSADLLKKHIPIVISVAALWSIVAIELILSMNLNHGHIIYALDDPYIHMAIAKNIVNNSIWGVTPYTFSSTSSSPLYILLLSLLYFLFGVHEITPFVLNMIFATLALIVMYDFLKRYITPFYTTITLILIILLSPFPAIIFTGMEHTLQILLVMLFAYTAASLTLKNTVSKNEYIFIAVLAALNTAIRYEGLLLLGAVCFVLVLNKHWKLSVVAMVCGILPVILYGAFSLHEGSYFLPNSIMDKSTLARGSTTGLSYLINSAATKFIMAFTITYSIVFSSMLLFSQNVIRDKVSHKIRIEKSSSIATSLLTILIITSILHVLFAEVGWFYRYEAYLMCLSIFVMAITLKKHAYTTKLHNSQTPIKTTNRYLTLILILLIITIPITARGTQALKTIPYATNNIYEQQYQMGLFINQYYNNDNIAVNDIGAICYLNDIHVLDFVGLANIDVTRLIKNNSYNAIAIKKLLTQYNTNIAICYEPNNIPSNWIKVGQWTIPNNVICFNDTVSFYAANQKEATKLKKNLISFSSKLPKDITQNTNDEII